MNRKTAAGCLVIVLAVLGFVFLRPGRLALLGDNVKILSVTAGGKPTGKGVISVPFTAKTPDKLYLNVARGTNWIVHNAVARPAKDWNNNFAYQEDSLTQDSKMVSIALSTAPVAGDQWSTAMDLAKTLIVERKTVENAATDSYEIGDLLDLSTVTDPEHSMKGDTVERPGTGAQPKPEGVPDTFKNDTPDLPQRKDECAPTSAANSIIRLAGDHGRIDAIPRDPTELIDGLKGQMGWTPQNGVLVGDFSPGKEAIAKQLGLPISSETVSGDAGHVIDRIEDTLNKDGAAEMQIKSTVTDAQGKPHVVGGHMVTVVAVNREGQSTSVQVHDPLSPSGTDTYQIDPNDGALINYPYLGGSASTAVRITVNNGFVQQWNEPTEGSIIDDLGGTGGRQWIKVINAHGKKIPLSEVTVNDPGQCPEDHYHASRNGVSKALDGTMVPDVAPQHCGFGTVKDTPIEECTPDGKECRPSK